MKSKSCCNNFVLAMINKSKIESNASYLRYKFNLVTVNKRSFDERLEACSRRWSVFIFAKTIFMFEKEILQINGLCDSNAFDWAVICRRSR